MSKTEPIKLGCVTGLRPHTGSLPFLLAHPSFLFPPASYQGRPIVLSLKLPALLHKFLEPLGSTLNSDTFFQKWNQLGGPPREVRQIIKAKEPVSPNTLREQVCCTVT